MRVDGDVSRRKYDLEVSRLINQRAALEARGIFMLGSSEFPYVNLFYAPRVPLRLLVPPPPNAPPNLPPNSMVMVDIPSMAGRGFTARIDLSDYDVVAPSIEFFDPWSNQPLPFELMFRAIEFEQQRGPHAVLLPDHPITHKPFLCLRGVREYHEHPQHTGDDCCRRMFGQRQPY